MVMVEEKNTIKIIIFFYLKGVVGTGEVESVDRIGIKGVRGHVAFKSGKFPREPVHVTHRQRCPGASFVIGEEIGEWGERMSERKKDRKQRSRCKQNSWCRDKQSPSYILYQTIKCSDAV